MSFWQSDTGQTWGLEHDACNAEILERLLSSPHDIIWRRDMHTLMMGDRAVALVDDNTHAIVAYFSFEVIWVEQLGRRAAEVRIWRSHFCAYRGPITHPVCLQVLLPRHDAIVSAMVEAPAEAAWGQVVAIAADVGRQVGVLVGGHADMRPSLQEFRSWYHGIQAWPRRFFITNLAR